MPDTIDIARLIRQIPTQYPFVLVDRVLEHDAGGLVAVKNVTGSEEFFEGHFPGAPVMPGVLIMESLAQAAGIWLLKDAADPRRLEVHLVGIDDAKFRRPAVPGDQLRLEVRVLRRRGSLCRLRGEVRAGDHRVAEADLLLQVATLPPPVVDDSAHVSAEAVLGPGVRIGPFAVIGPGVRLGARTVVEAHAVVDGDTTLGADNRLYPFCSVGLAPQDLKYKGEPTRLVIGDRNVIRECVTIHRGTGGGGSVTRIGDDNLFMAYAHVAHDCLVGSHTIFANGATLAGHVDVGDFATIGAYSGVHQFCRVGRYAFVGGYSVITQDVLPFSSTVSERTARVFGANRVGLERRGFSTESIEQLQTTFRLLTRAGLNTSQAIERIRAEVAPGAEVEELIEFIGSSKRGFVK